MKTLPRLVAALLATAEAPIPRQPFNHGAPPVLLKATATAPPANYLFSSAGA